MGKRKKKKAGGREQEDREGEESDTPKIY